MTMPNSTGSHWTPATRARSAAARNHDDGNTPRDTALLTADAPTPAAADNFFRPTASAKSDAFMVVQFTQIVGSRKHTFGVLPHISARGYAASMAKSENPYLGIGIRLTAVRKAFGGQSQAVWSERHGFAPSQYGNWESGLRRIPVDSAEKLCDLYGLDLDYIYRGKRDGLSENASKVL